MKGPNQEDSPRTDTGTVSRLDVIVALYLGIMGLFGTLSFLRVTPITNCSDYINEISQRQNYSDDLTEAPCVFARLDNGAIPMDLGHIEYAFSYFGNRKTTHHQLEGRDTISSRSGEGKKVKKFTKYT